jgi:hypothetical protein
MVCKITLVNWDLLYVRIYLFYLMILTSFFWLKSAFDKAVKALLKS